MTNPLPYLEQRKLVKRWSGPIAPIANLIFTLILFAITWWVFQDPRGVMRFYTPYVGYNYCRWWLIILIWMAYIFDFWPFKRKWLETAHPLQKGLVLSLLSVAIMIMMIHGFFQSVLGNTAFAYFNPQQLLKLKGLTEFYATEYAAQACMMFAVIASWISPAWVVALEGRPWENLAQPAKGFSIWLGTFCLSFVIYFMTMLTTWVSFTIRGSTSLPSHLRTGKNSHRPFRPTSTLLGLCAVPLWCGSWKVSGNVIRSQ